MHAQHGGLLADHVPKLPDHGNAILGIGDEVSRGNSSEMSHKLDACPFYTQPILGAESLDHFSSAGHVTLKP